MANPQGRDTPSTKEWEVRHRVACAKELLRLSERLRRQDEGRPLLEVVKDKNPVRRELRRVDYPLSGYFEAARQSADKGDWCGFMEAMGGHQTPFRSQLIKILRVWFDKPGIYGDPIGLIVTGIDCDGEPITTRTREWRIEYIPQIQASRTCVNNCTGHHSLFFNSNVNSSPREGHQWLSDSS